ncbi:U6 snRNA phosphodiesterase, partial [Asbolus verrucosus]
MSNKGALDLLAAYGGDSSDEEVPGSRVSTKRTHKDDKSEPNHKRFEKLPVPDFMLKNPEEVTDNPSLHEDESNEGLKKLLSTIMKLVPEDIELKCLNDFHISLTKTVILKHHWIDSFVSTLKENVSYITRFIIMLSSLDIYCNEEKTRTFIGLQIKTGFDSLLKLVQCLNNSLGEFKLPKFYENPSFHISIAWCLGDCTDKLKAILPDLNNELQEVMNEYPQENWYIYVQHIMCRI